MVWLGFSSKMGFCPTSNVWRSSRKPILRILELKPSFSSGLRLIIGFFFFFFTYFEVVEPKEDFVDELYDTSE